MKYILGFLSLLVSPMLAFADGPGTEAVGLKNPLTGGVDSIYAFVVLILNNIVLPIGSVVVVIFIIYTGFLFVTARGNESKLETAKHSLLWVVVGTAILLGSVVIASAINGTLCQIAPNLPGCFIGPPLPPGF